MNVFSYKQVPPKHKRRYKKHQKKEKNGKKRTKTFSNHFYQPQIVSNVLYSELYSSFFIQRTLCIFFHTTNFKYILPLFEKNYSPLKRKIFSPLKRNIMKFRNMLGKK